MTELTLEKIYTSTRSGIRTLVVELSEANKYSTIVEHPYKTQDVINALHRLADFIGNSRLSQERSK